MTVLLIHSQFGAVPRRYAELFQQGRLTIIRDRDLTSAHIEAAAGIITGIHLDQVGLSAQAPALAELLARGGRLFFNGHVIRPFVSGLRVYKPLERPTRADYTLSALCDHPIFSGIPMGDLEENKGVAGFYGRGHNPMPQDARAVTGLGPLLLPIDWEWTLPGGGKLFSHAGNDLGMGQSSGHADLLTERVVGWCAGDIN